MAASRSSSRSPASTDWLEDVRCPFCQHHGGEAVAESGRVVCRNCGQYITDYNNTTAPIATIAIRFVVTLEPTNPAHSIHALRRFLKNALRHFGLRCVDLREEVRK